MVNRTHDWLETNAGAVQKPPVRVARDWALFALILVGAVAEVALIDVIAWRWLGVAIGLTLALPTLWRRTRPLLP